MALETSCVKFGLGCVGVGDVGASELGLKVLQDTVSGDFDFAAVVGLGVFVLVFVALPLR